MQERWVKHRDVTHSRVKVLRKLLEVCQRFAEVNVDMLTVEQDAQYRLRCTCIVDHLATTVMTQHILINSLPVVVMLSVTNHFIMVTLQAAHGLSGSAGSKMSMGVFGRFFSRKVGHSDLDFGVPSRFISRSLHARLQVYVQRLRFVPP